MVRKGEGTKFTIDRKIFSSDIWQASPWKLKIWLYLVGNANHKDGVFKGIELKRGQLIRSYRTIQDDCSYYIGYRKKKPSLSTISKICEELTKDARIELRKEHYGQVITILNYNKLQSLKKREANDEANDMRTGGEQNKNDKECKKKINKRKNSKTTCPDIFPVTDKMRQYAASKNHYPELEDLTEAFLLHHRKKGSKFADWYAAWQTWFRNDIKFNGPQDTRPMEERLRQENR